MKIVIDATNLKAGGGLTHLKQISKRLNKIPELEVHIIGGDWINSLENDNRHIYKEYFNSVFKQEYFKRFKLPTLVKEYDLVFAPGGSFYSKKVKYVTMCRNMLIFESKERSRFPLSLTWIRYVLLEKMQLKSYMAAEGIIYISNYAKSYVESKYPALKSKKSVVIYHGISDDFRQIPKEQIEIERYTRQNPLRISYISIVNFYKHQWNVVEAVKKLRQEGYFIHLELIGPMYKGAKKLFYNSIQGTEEFVSYKGKVPYEEIMYSYKNSDVFVFASTCENMPNILVEAMSAGLPILCSNYGPMPEILKDGGVYMDPTNVDNIYKELKIFLLNKNLRQEKSKKAYEYSKAFSWTRTVEQTIEFIKQVV